MCGIIESGDSRFLAAKRNLHQTNGGLWEFPGGKIETGESPAQALQRELYEELGITIATDQILKSSYFSYPHISIELIPIICTISSGTPYPHEHEEIRWVNQEEALTLEWASADLPIVTEYLKKSGARS